MQLFGHREGEAMDKIERLRENRDTKFPAQVKVIHNHHQYMAFLEDGLLLKTVKLVMLDKHEYDESVPDDTDVSAKEGDLVYNRSV
jgi:hypothetical protein